MPRIPTYERQVENAPMPTNRLSLNTNPDMFGAAEARQAGEIGEAVGNIASVALRKVAANESMKTKALARDDANNAESEGRELMMGVYAKRGKDALSAYKDAETGLKNIRQRYIDGAKTLEQKEYFSTWFDSVMKSHLDSAMAHQMKQTEEFNDQTTLAQNQSFKENMQLDHTNEEVMSRNEKDLETNIRAFGARKGWSEDMVKQEIEKERDAAYQGVVGSIAQQSTVAALKFMDAHKDKFDPQTFNEKRAAVEKAAKSEVVLNTALELSNSGLPIDEQLAKADAIKDADTALGVRKMIIDRYEEKVKLDDTKDKAYIQDEINKLLQNPKTYKLPPFAPKELAVFVANHRKSLVSEIAGQAESDWGLYHDLAMQIKDGKYVDLTKYRQNFELAEFKALMNLQVSSRDPQKKAAAFRTFSLHEQYETALAGLPRKQFDPKEGGADAAQRRSRFISQLDNLVQQIPEEKRTQEAIEQVIKDLTGKMIVREGVVGIGKKEVYRFEVGYLPTREEQTKAFTQNPPANLAGLPSLNYDSASSQYYVDMWPLRTVYDRFGNKVGVWDMSGATK